HKKERSILSKLRDEALHMHKINQGKLKLESKVPVKNAYDLSLAYLLGVAEPCKEIYSSKNAVYDYTMKGNTVGVVTDGSAVLGLCNLVAESLLSVIVVISVLFKTFVDVVIFSFCLATNDIDEIVQTVKFMELSFGGINLEYILAPDCFIIEERLIIETRI